MTDIYELEFFAEDDGTKPVLAWIKNDLTPAQRRAIGTAMRRVLQVNGIGVCSSPWGRQLGGGLFEFRVRLTGRQMLNESWARAGGIDGFRADPAARLLPRLRQPAHPPAGRL